MGNTVEFLLKLKDMASGPLDKLAGRGRSAFGSLKNDIGSSQSKLEKLGHEVSDVNHKLDGLGTKRTLRIDTGKLESVGRELGKIQRMKGQLESRSFGKGMPIISGLGNMAGMAGMGGMGGGLLSMAGNPYLLAGGAAVGIGTKAVSKYMDWDKGIAQANITARLNPMEREGMSSRIQDIAIQNNVRDLFEVPAAFEKILSVTNDLEASYKLLDVTLKGSKAGFTDAAEMAQALSKTWNVLGGKVGGMEISDTMFAAQRMGAAQVKDIAQYVPGLISSAQPLGFDYKQTAAAYSYLTTKESPEVAAMLMENFLTAIRKADVVSKMEGAGILPKGYTQGKGKTTYVDIASKVNKAFEGLKPGQLPAFLKGIDLNDAQAVRAFTMFSQGVDKFKEISDAVSNSKGETAMALEASTNKSDELAAAMSRLDLSMVKLGQSMSWAVDLAAMGATGLAKLGEGVGYILNDFGSRNIAKMKAQGNMVPMEDDQGFAAIFLGMRGINEEIKKEEERSLKSSHWLSRRMGIMLPKKSDLASYSKPRQDELNSVPPVATQTMAGIHGGGAKNLTINVSKFFEDLVINSASPVGAMPEFEKTLKETLMRVVNSGSAVISY